MDHAAYRVSLVSGVIITWFLGAWGEVWSIGPHGLHLRGSQGSAGDETRGHLTKLVNLGRIRYVRYLLPRVSVPPPSLEERVNTTEQSVGWAWATPIDK